MLQVQIGRSSRVMMTMMEILMISRWRGRGRRGRGRSGRRLERILLLLIVRLMLLLMKLLVVEMNYCGRVAGLVRIIDLIEKRLTLSTVFGVSWFLVWGFGGVASASAFLASEVGRGRIRGSSIYAQDAHVSGIGPSQLWTQVNDVVVNGKFRWKAN